MTDKTDKALEEFLDGKSPVSRGYARLGAIQPPAALDRTILAAASEAVAREEDATVVRVRRFHKWSVSVALAATVVVAVPLVVRVIDLRINEPQPVLDHQVSANRPDAPVDLELIAPSSLTDRAPSVAAAARQPEAPPAAAAPQSTVPGTTPAPAEPPTTVLRRSDLPPAQLRVVEPNGKVRSNNAYVGNAEAEVEAEAVAVQAEAADNALERLRELRAVSARQATRARPEQLESDTGNTMAMDAPATAAPPATAKGMVAEESVVLTGARLKLLDPRNFIQRIMGLYRSDQKRAARREFGEFLTMYPDAELPDNFPLDRSEAIYPQRRIVQEADDWLRDIAGLADEGRIDAARQALARFFDRYPDYELPNWFPLTREDAAPIER